MTENRPYNVEDNDIVNISLEEEVNDQEYGNENEVEKKVLPVLCLRGLVVFPHMVLPLLVGREKSIAALEEAMMEEKRIFLVAQKVEDAEDPDVDDLFSVGTLAEIKQLVKLPDGTLKIIVEGLERGRIKEFVQMDPYYRVTYEIFPEEEPKGTEVTALMRAVLTQFETYIKVSRRIPPEIMTTVVNVEQPGRLADIIVSHITLKLKDQQELLESIDPQERLEKLYNILGREIEILEVEQKIHNRVRKQVEKTQKEYYLKEQLKAIKEELGTGDEETEIEEYRTKIEELGLPDEVKTKALKEVDRLEYMPSHAAEAAVIRTYLDTLLDLPWNKYSDEELDLKRAKKILDEDHYGLKEVKERILEYLAVRKLSPKLKSPILCLIGAPGVGKTSLGRSIARAVNREFVRLSLGGVRDEAEIRGHRRTYIGARPGRVINAMREAGTKNPVFLLDEIDKMSSDFRGDPAAALLEVLDPEQNNAFTDHYLEVPFDLSQVMFITTANVAHTIPRPLLDRMEVLEIPGYTDEEKIQIAKRHLIPKQMKEHGLSEKNISISDSAIKLIIQEYTREAGVRNLERKIAAICRKVAKDVVAGKETLSRITAQNLRKYLGVPRYRYGRSENEDRVGVATGMAYTEVGGDILDIEVAVVEGKGDLTLTGQMGDVMKESARAALSYVRARRKELGLPKDFYKKFDLHIHVPEGAVPKDGPSAGITMTTAIISALSNRPVRGDVAMTGEITLRGRVLAVGGIKTKVLAAHRAGIKKIILPRENERNLEEIPKQVRRELEFFLVDHMDQVLEVALKWGEEDENS
ncbi:endopeptidase La [Anoxybacter fermentans]|uniref:endopeptidase La n=1 Tax=Anoxybacter fermentans TaxID=1323375 RepID=UPI000F8EF374|nr:endopeptidase La [Anoxybacter fermentans]